MAYIGQIRIILAILFIAISAGYSYYAMRDIIAGPTIAALSPNDGDNVSSSLVTVSGNVQRASLVTLNDREILIDESGEFTEQLLLPNGYTIISVEARDKLGRSDQKILHITH